MVNNPGYAVCKGQGGKLFNHIPRGIIPVTKVHGKIIGTVVAAAGSGQAYCIRVKDGELRHKAAIGRQIRSGVVGDGMATTPIAAVTK